MKKTLICSLLAIAATSFAGEAINNNANTINVASGSSAVSDQTPTKNKTPKAMNALPVNKNLDKSKIQKVDQPKQPGQLVGSNSATWTPAYLKVDGYKKCLDVQDYRGWQGLCMPAKQPKDCLDQSWSKLQQINLVPCAKNAS